MRKIVLFLSVFIASSMCANAYIDNMYMTTGQFMVNTGYSSEMSKMMNIVNQDPYREPTVEGKGQFWDRVYNYVAPAVNTDLDFYNHSINYTRPNWRDY